MIPSGVSGFPQEMEFPYPKPDRTKNGVSSSRRADAGRGEEHGSLLLRRPAVEDCFCLDHGPTPEVSYMRYVRAKDERIYGQLQNMRGAMANCACDILEHQCNNENDKMGAFHIIDYIKRGHSPCFYVPLERVKECAVGTPIEPLRVGLANGYRDHELFPFQQKARHLVDKNHSFVYTQTPVHTKHWFSPLTIERSEYEDTYSRLGLARMRNARQYLEPQPSSRLRAGDPNC